MGFKPYYLDLVMIKRDNSLWKSLLFCQNCMETKMCVCDNKYYKMFEFECQTMSWKGVSKASHL